MKANDLQMQAMKIALLNFSGNVGKSTIARHLFAPRMHDAQIFSVETVNSDGNADSLSSRGKDFLDTLIQVGLAGNAVVDIGASNSESVMQMLAQNPGSHEDFDYFIVPTVPSRKQQRDTLSTIDELARLGVQAERIRVIFNQVEPGDIAKNVFSGLFDYHKQEHKFELRANAVIHTNPFFPKLAGSTASIAEILTDQTNCKAAIEAATDQAEKLRYLQLLALKRGAAGVQTELDAVHTALF